MTVRHTASPETINAEVAARLEEVAHLLEEQDANPFRVDAYRRAAETVRGLPESVAVIYRREGLKGLDRLPTIGPAIARAIRDIVVTGQLPLLERLRGEAGDIAVLTSVPGIGEVLARRLRDEYGIETLEELETAAHDGTLDRIPGFGRKRVRGIQDALAQRLRRARRADVAGAGATDDRPDVRELLDVDREYREKVAAGRLRRIAPRRFNPTNEAWLPVLHTQRGSRHYTAMFSNTAQAHKLGKTRDWVVIYYDTPNGEGQATVVTAQRGALAGKRVVRGREAESAAVYEAEAASRDSS
ncbi:MAG TPA: helix-hairpin-helix domain-containing protein [Gemmatimonadaceae bacterium]|nr:helix-hairpin-helix domain-containing protein [Gemmatimonadaceae bacterium]